MVLPPNGSPTMDPFDFNRAGISPYLSAPSSPKSFGEYYYSSAPTTPSRFFNHFDYFHSQPTQNIDDGFAFFVTDEPHHSSRSAEELFDDGKIKPLNEDAASLDSAKSPLLSRAQPKKSPLAQGKKVIRDALSRKIEPNNETLPLGEERRGRDRIILDSSSYSRRSARSLSPYRVSHYTWDEEQQPRNVNKEDSVAVTTALKSSRKWRLRDFLLFRSASEGRGSSKDPLRKFPAFYKKAEPKNRGSDWPRTRRKEPVSAHELHYARKKVESEDLKKRTFLPYKQGILGRLAGLGTR
ncbi:hypothetical protein RJT34_08643 [Clitoria ternatea]|uniref:Uncharacterized protein n=1 Tax=Clitoria ternatea TaxID=43366 RepID=A0AAN9K6L1_CLITE